MGRDPPRPNSRTRRSGADQAVRPTVNRTQETKGEKTNKLRNNVVQGAGALRTHKPAPADATLHV